MPSYFFSKPIIYCHRDRFVLRLEKPLYNNAMKDCVKWPIVITGSTMVLAYLGLVNYLEIILGPQAKYEFLDGQCRRLHSVQYLIGN